MILKGTINELEQFIPWQDLCKGLGIDYYNRGIIPTYEVFELEYPIVPKLKPITAKFTYNKYFDVDDYLKYCKTHKISPPSQKHFEVYAKTSLKREIKTEIYDLDDNLVIDIIY